MAEHTYSALADIIRLYSRSDDHSAYLIESVLLLAIVASAEKLTAGLVDLFNAKIV